MNEALRILILDDSEADLLLIERELQKTNLEFISCQVQTGKDFNRALQTFTPDIILADYHLPSFNGLDALRIVRHRMGIAIPFIIVTGQLDEKTAAKFMHAGADDYILKENLKQIAPAILSVLQKKQVRKEKELAEQISQKRGAILEAISFSAEKILRTDRLEENIPEVLSQLGQATESAAISIFKNEYDPSSGKLKNCHLSQFWSADKYPGYSSSGKMPGHISAGDLRKLFPDLESGKVQTVSASKLPEKKRTLFFTDTKFFIIAVPIFVGDNWWGFLEFTVPGEEKWTPPEMDALRAAAGIIGGAIQRKKSESEVKMLAHAVQSIREGICITGLDKNIIFVNEAFSKIYGYSQNEIMGRPLTALFGKKLTSRKINRIFSDLGKGGWQSEIISQRKDGTSFPSDLSVSRLLDSAEETSAFVMVIRDLTRAKQDQTALQTSKTNLSAILENTNDSIFSVDRKFRILFLNTVFQHMYFRAFGEKLQPGMDITEQLPPEIKREWRKILGKSFDGEPFTYEWKYKHKDQFRYFEISFHPIMDTNRSQRGTSVYGREITERKKIEEQFRHQARQRKYLLDISQSVLSSLELPEVIRRMHTALDQVVGIDISGVYLADLEKEQLIPYIHTSSSTFSQHLQDKPLLIDRSLSGYVFKTGKALLINNAHLDPRSCYPPGAEVDCEHLISIPIMSEGQKLGVISINRLADPPFNEEEFELVKLFSNHVSLAIANARLFEKTRQSEEKFRTLFEETRDVVFICDRNWRFLDINAAGVELFGYPNREALLNETNSEKFFPDVNAFQLLNKNLIHRQFIQDYEIEMKTRDGKSLIVLITANVMRDKNDKIRTYRGFIRDISEQKRLAEQLRHAQRMESLGTLAGGIAHDFNNLLAIILGYSSLLEQGEMDDEKRKWISSSIETAVDRGANLVNQILTFARKQPVQFGVIQINDITRETIQMLSETFPKTISFKTRLAKHLPRIEADSNQLHQAIINLCVNAKDAMENYGQLTIETELIPGTDLQKQFPRAKKQPYVHLSISDTGSGIDKETREHIFEPFFTTKPRGRGTGLGLAVVYGMIESHRGFIDVASRTGEGTTFELYFPACEKEAPVQDSKPNLTPEAGSEIILLVEDEEMLQELMEKVITNKGYGFLSARDGLRAVELFRQRHREIALVIMDIGLPRLDGWEAYLQMKKIDPDIKVIFASGYFDPKIKNQMNQLGINHSLKKPYNPREVLKTMREVLGKNVEP